MIRNYFTRIISQAIRKLLYPELVEIRATLDRIEQREALTETRTQEGLKKCDIDLPGLSNELKPLLTDAVGTIKNQLGTLRAGIDAQIEEKVCREITAGNIAAEQRDSQQRQNLSELCTLVENSYERIHKRDAAQSEKIAALSDLSEQGFGRLNQAMELVRSQFTDDMKILDKQLDDLYRIIVKREEHTFLINDVQGLKQEVALLKRDILRKSSGQS